MKKLLTIVLAVIALFTLVACADQSQTQNAASDNKAAEPAPQAAPAENPPAEKAAESGKKAPVKALVVYFSWSGNTESVAKHIAGAVGADTFQVKAATDYGKDYDE